jgi:hypothetical protein
MATFEEQINAILRGGIHPLVRKETGKAKITPGDYSKVFTIRKSDIIQWINENGIPDETCHRKSGRFDGIYLIESESIIELYYQERACKFEEKQFQRTSELTETLVDMILHHSALNIK